MSKKKDKRVEESTGTEGTLLREMSEVRSPCERRAFPASVKQPAEMGERTGSSGRFWREIILRITNGTKLKLRNLLF